MHGVGRWMDGDGWRWMDSNGLTVGGSLWVSRKITTSTTPTLQSLHCNAPAERRPPPTQPTNQNKPKRAVNNNACACMARRERKQRTTIKKEWAKQGNGDDGDGDDNGVASHGERTSLSHGTSTHVRLSSMVGNLRHRTGEENGTPVHGRIPARTGNK